MNSFLILTVLISKEDLRKVLFNGLPYQNQNRNTGNTTNNSFTINGFSFYSVPNTNLYCIQILNVIN